MTKSSLPPEPAGLVFVVDDDEAIRDALSVHLDLAGFQVRPFASADAFLAAMAAGDGEATALDGCVVADIRMPGTDGLAMQREMARRGLTLPVIIITGHGDVPAAVSAFRAGAIDFLQKPFDEDVLIARIAEALTRHRRQRLLAAEVADIRHRRRSLSPREREVMDLVAQGLANKVVAIRLDIGVRTVETHRARILEKMGVHTVAELTRMRLRLDDAMVAYDTNEQLSSD